MSHVIKQPPPKAFALENGELGGGGNSQKFKNYNNYFYKNCNNLSNQGAKSLLNKLENV